jgi:urease accessory protein UreF
MLRNELTLKLRYMKKLILLLMFVNTTSYAQMTYQQMLQQDSLIKALREAKPISREQEREATHFMELMGQSKEHKEVDSLNAIYNKTTSHKADMRMASVAVTKGYGNDEMQYLYGVIRTHEGKIEIIDYYLKYDKGKRKIVGVSKQPIQ